MPSSVYAYLRKNLCSLDFLSFSDLAIYDSTATYFWSFNYATKKLLLIDLKGIFYQFHHVTSFRARFCPRAESSCEVSMMHLQRLIVTMTLNSVF